MGTIQIDGSTPKLTIGNATAEDATILFDGAAQDFHIGLDDTADDLVIGVGSALGTTTALAIDENAGSTFSGTVTVGVDDTGKDVKFFGATSGKYWLWDESADGVVQIGTLTVGVDDAGHDVKFFGATASRYWLWDESADGVVQRGTLTVGVDDTGHDVKLFGATSGSYALWDESADDLNLIASGLGVVSAKDLGVGVHIRSADSGASVNGEADELVIEGSGYSGITILSGASQGGAVMFGDSGDNGIGRLYYDHSSNTMQLVAGANKVMDLTSGSIVINEDSDDVDFRVESDSSATMFNLQGANSNNSAGSIGLNSSNSDGNFFEAINPQSGVYTALFNSSASSGAVHGISLYNSQQNPDDNTSQFLVASDGSAVRMRIYSDGDLQNHDNSYGSTSDERIKQQIADSTSQWDDLKAVKVRKFKFNSDVADKGDSDALWRLGVIAQELEASSMNGLVKPEVKYKEGDQETRDYLYTEKDKDTGEIPEGKDVGDVKKAKTADVGDIRDYKSVKYSILYMKAIKALQEAQTRIETLETKVTALEG